MTGAAMPERQAGPEEPQHDERWSALHRAFHAASSTDEVCQVVVDHGADLVGATASSIALLDETGEWVEVVCSRGYTPEVLERFARFRADADLPLAEAIRSQRIVLLGGREELLSRYESIRDDILPPNRQATASLPVQVGDHVIGAIGLSFDARVEVDDEMVPLLRAMAEDCGRALERTMAVAAESARLQQRMDAARGRLAFVSAATRELSRSLDRDDVLETLTQLVVPRFADWASVLLPEGGELVAATLVHRDRLEDDLRERAGRFRLSVDSDTVSCRVFRTGEPALVHGVDADIQARMDAYPELRDQLGMTRARLVVPITAQDHTLGVLTLADAGQASFDEDDLAVAGELASRAGTALDNAARFAAERDMVEVLQRAVLPAELPHGKGLLLTARYQPASTSANVGGDWYDAFELRDGRIGLCIGDVVGHGIEAAACMGQLRNALRVYALDGDEPREVVGALNRFAIDTATTDFATMLYAVYEPGTGRLTWTSAGHPPLVCRRHDGVETFDAGHGVPIGIAADLDYESSTTVLSPGDVVVLVTDGLIERRNEPLLMGLDRLEAILGATRGAPLEDIAEQILAEVAPAKRDDDVCILLLEHHPLPPPTEG